MQKRFLIADTYRTLTAEMFVVLSSNDFFVPHFLVLHLFKCQLRVWNTGMVEQPMKTEGEVGTVREAVECYQMKDHG